MIAPMNQYNIIGTITRITGYDEASDTHETETLEGYHVNTIEPVPEWEQYRAQSALIWSSLISGSPDFMSS